MEIILKEDVLGLGYKNDIVTVKNGYGRNYLIPTGKGIIASSSAKKMLAEELKQRAHWRKSKMTLRLLPINWLLLNRW
jgi:large subunit ribosomal protein L9